MSDENIAHGVGVKPIVMTVRLPIREGAVLTEGTRTQPFEKVKHLMSSKPLPPWYRGPPPSGGPGAK